MKVKPLQSLTNRVFLWGAVCWIGMLAFLAVQPEAVVELILRKKSLFEPAHVVAYAILSFFLCLYFRSAFRRFGDLAFVCVLAFLVSALCGGITEWIQIFSLDRIPDWLDFRMDLLGSVSGISLFLIVRSRRAFRAALEPESIQLPKRRQSSV